MAESKSHSYVRVWGLLMTLLLLVVGSCSGFLTSSPLKKAKIQPLAVASVDPREGTSSSFHRRKGESSGGTSRKKPYWKSKNHGYRSGNSPSSTTITVRRRRHSNRSNRSSSGSSRGDWRDAAAEMEFAQRIEQQLVAATEQLRLARSQPPGTSHSLDDAANPKSSRGNVLSFPTVRECNEALAVFGDAGDLLRALRLFGKMRKLIPMQQQQQQQQADSRTNMLLPVPSLVTYSTLMSRAVKIHKPRVALRLWNLMMNTHGAATTTTATDAAALNGNSGMADIVPDVKACNILMNCYAKLSNVKRAQQLWHEMKHGQRPDGRPNGLLRRNQRLTPNLVTLNTLLNACQKAGNLDAAWHAKQELDALHLQPDARTYTTLIATVARGPSQWSGQNDPSLAFSLLQEMQSHHLIPNGMTYSALIDACGRCRRSDLALQGLRMMLRQKAQEQKSQQQQQQRQYQRRRRPSPKARLNSRPYTLPNEVGAWTAAIDACGKCGRLETATKLFYAMPTFGCDPNTVTCGCLTDSLLRAGQTAETLNVLRYMKRHQLQPTEVMYTSLMTRAERLVQMERNLSGSIRTGNSSGRPKPLRLSNSDKDEEKPDEDNDPMGTDEASGTKAIEVYAQLMWTLVDASNSATRKANSANTEAAALDQPSADLASKRTGSSSSKSDPKTVLVKVFLVFQQMKASGAVPDIACYNALLRACARAGEFDHAWRILTHHILASKNVEPNDTSWRELLRAASRLHSSDSALQVWRQGLAWSKSQPSVVVGTEAPKPAADEEDEEEDDDAGNRWTPSAMSFAEFLHAFAAEAQHAASVGDSARSQGLYESVVGYYRQVVVRQDKKSNDGEATARLMSRVPWEQVQQHRRTLWTVLQAAVDLHKAYGSLSLQGQEMQALACSILRLDSFAEYTSSTTSPRRLRLSPASRALLERAERWLF